jgi:hypothetical protein
VDKPNVEKLVIGWLEDHANITWPVHGDMPETRPEKFLLVDRTGGAREAMVLDTAEILIEVYHKSSREMASDEANKIADLIPELKALESITRAKVNSVIKLDDTIGKFWRYQIYVDVFNRR